MSVTIRTTTGHTAEITWEPGDDPKGYLARAVESDQLSSALESLGGHIDPAASDEDALAQAAHTATLARLLERQAALQVVQLRDVRGLSWRQIAIVVLESADRQSSVRRMYESGRRHLGV